MGTGLEILLRCRFAVCAAVEAELVEMDRKANHDHLLVNSPPEVPVATRVTRRL